jgi:hypothetical protein
MPGSKDNTQSLVWANQGFDGGLVSFPPAHLLDGSESPDAQNWDPSEREKLKKRKGYYSFTGTHGSPTGTALRGLYATAFENGTQVLLAKEGTAVYNISAGNWSTTITGHPALADADNVHFTTFKNVIIMASERITPMQLQEWSGSGTWGNLSGAPSCKYVAVHKGRIFAANNGSDPSKVYFSAVNDKNDWTTADNAGNFFVAPGDGMLINGIISDGETLYISKSGINGGNGAMYAVFGDGPTSFVVRRISYFGAVSQRAMVATASYAAVATQEGIFGLSANRLIFISDPVNNYIKDLTNAERAEICLGKHKNQLWASMPAPGGSSNSLTLVYDQLDQRWSKYTYAGRIIIDHPDGNIYIASPNSTIRVFRGDYGTDDLGSAIEAYWWTPDLDFGAWWLDKQWLKAALHVKVDGRTWTLTHNIDGITNSDSYSVVGNATTDPVKTIDGYPVAATGRFFRFKIRESSTSAAEVYGLLIEAESFPGDR